MKFILNLLLSGLAVLAAAYLIPSVHVDSLRIAILVAVVLAAVNATVGFVLKFMTLPLNILTLGLVGLIINVLMVLLVDSLIGGFSTGGFWSAAIFAILLCVFQLLFGLKDKK